MLFNGLLIGLVMVLLQAVVVIVEDSGEEVMEAEVEEAEVVEETEEAEAVVEAEDVTAAEDLEEEVEEPEEEVE